MGTKPNAATPKTQPGNVCVMRLGTTMLIMLLASCGGVRPPVSQTAICEETEVARDRLAHALLEQPPSQATVAGANLISLLDAGCADQAHPF